MPAFDDEVAAASADTDAVFAEDFAITPYVEAADKRAASTPDASRPTIALIAGIWFDKPANPHEPNAYDSREWRRPGVGAGAPHVEFSPAAIAGAAGFVELRDGDRVQRLSSGVAYQVRGTFITPNGVLRAALNRLG